MLLNGTDTEADVAPESSSQTFQYTSQPDQPLSREVVMSVSRASGIDPIELHQGLHEVINPTALNALFQPTVDGTPRQEGTVEFLFHGYRVSAAADGTIILQSEFNRLKQTGMNLLVCGTVPDRIRDVMSACLLGDATRERAVLFVLTDCPTQTALDRLVDSQIPEQQAHVFSTDDSVRSAVTRPSSLETDATLSTVTGSLDGIHTALLRTLDELEQSHDGFAPAELRVCFDSLRPYIDMNDIEQVTTVLDKLCDVIVQHSGMGQFLLPYAFVSPEIQSVRSCFDFVLELRISQHGPEYRWHFNITGFTTQWLPL